MPLTRRSVVARGRWLLLLGCLACGAESGGAGGERLAPGDSLLERLDGARVLACPESNLEPGVRAHLTRVEGADGPGLMVPLGSAPIPAAAWKRGDPIPAARLPHWARRTGRAYHLWSTGLPFYVASQAEGDALEFLQDGQPLREPDGGMGPGEDMVLSWNHDLEVLMAVADAPPRDVVVVRRRPAAAVFGRLERRLLRGDAELPAAPELRHALQLDDAERAGLLLPAPGRLAVPVGTLAADGLAFGIAMSTFGWRDLDGAVREVRNPGDGVLCALEVDVGSGPTRAWQAHVTPADGLLEFEVDLSSLRGLDAVVHLVSEPGRRGDAGSDHVVFTGLRAVGPPRRAPDRPHLVLIDIDTLRADALGASLEPGGPSVTPRLDAWTAEQALVFEDVQSTASWTLPATASLLTGLAVHQHGLRFHGLRLAPDVRGLAERLSAAGYECRAWTEGGYVHPTFGFGRGFDVYAVAGQRELDWQAPLDWLASRRSERPAFVFVHSYLVHAPYPHEPAAADADYRGPLAGRDVDFETVIHPVERGELTLDAADRDHVRRLYLAGVARMDARVGALLDGLEAHFGDEPYVVALTSDHGELLGEHGLIDHHKSLYQEVLAVPLLLRTPQARAGRESTPASLLDVLPTLLDAVDLPVPDDLPGRSLLDPARRDVERVAQHGGAAHSLTVAGVKLVRGITHDRQAPDDTLQLFDLGADPGETLDLADERAADAARLERRLSAWLARWPVVVGELDASVDGATEKALRSLGYLGGDG